MKVLVTVLGSAGDVQPAAGIARRLADRGHEVTMITSPHFAAPLARLGLDLVPVLDDTAYRRAVEHADLWHPVWGLRRLAREGLVPTLRLVYGEIARRHDPDAPDETLVVAFSLELGGRLAHEKLGVPLVTVHLAPAALRSRHLPPVLGPIRFPGGPSSPLARLPAWMLDRVLVPGSFGRELNRFRRELGLGPISRPLADWWHSPQLVLGMFPDWLAPPQPDWPAQVELAGFPLWQWPRERDPGLAKWLASVAPPVVFTAGTAMRHGRRFFAAAAEACSRLDRPGILVASHAEQMPRPLPPGVRYAPSAPFEWLFARASAVVHHGGIGTAARGLAAALPQVVVPFAFDQHDNAARLVRLGIAEEIRPDRVDGKRLAAALGRLLETAPVAERARELAGRLTGGDGVGRACDLIERTQRHRPERSSRGVRSK